MKELRAAKKVKFGKGMGSPKEGDGGTLIMGLYMHALGKEFWGWAGM